MKSRSRDGARATPVGALKSARVPVPSEEPARFEPPPATVFTINPFHVDDGDVVWLRDVVADLEAVRDEVGDDDCVEHCRSRLAKITRRAWKRGRIFEP